MPQIVTQAGNLHTQHVLLRDPKPRLVVLQGPHHPGRHVRHAKTVLEARVRRPAEDEVAGAQLFQSVLREIGR